jgi:large subunit ribosomal protein L23
MERLGDKLSQYGFIVEKSANKLEIKKAIEELYGVTVDSINTIRYAGKLKSRYTKSGFLSGRTNSIKKAIVTLKEGEKIDFYSNI